jgi:uncharacterized membrane protein YgdD (TMEM256/DUF423 family)
MRVLNICAALSGLIALVMLALAAHALDEHPESVADVNLGGYIQLGAAATGLAIANRRGVLNMIGGGLVVAGAAIFAGALYAVALLQNSTFAMAAPAGGLSLMAGFLVLAFAKPGS